VALPLRPRRHLDVNTLATTQEKTMALDFLGTEAFYEQDRSALCWYADVGREAVLCKATTSAIGSLYKPAEFTADDYRIIFARHRMIFEAAASQKFGTLRSSNRRPIVVKDADVAPHRGKFGEYHRRKESHAGTAGSENIGPHQAPPKRA
jgi:hypothetical protein